jgi:hypothetical protein
LVGLEVRQDLFEELASVSGSQADLDAPFSVDQSLEFEGTSRCKGLEKEFLERLTFFVRHISSAIRGYPFELSIGHEEAILMQSATK